MIRLLPGRRAVLAAPGLVVVPPTTARLAELWQEVAGLAASADAPASPGRLPDLMLGRLLDLMVRDGVHPEGFAIALLESEEARVVVRGDVVVVVRTADGETDVRAGAGVGWVERTVPGALGVEVVLEAADDAAEVVLAGPVLIAAARVGIGAPAPEPEPVAPAAPEPVVDVVPEPVREPELAPEPLPEPQPEVAPEPEAMTVADLPSMPAGPREVPLAELFEPVAASTDHDGHTRTGAWQPGLPAVGIPGQPDAPAVTARPVAVLRLSTGEEAPVDRPIVLGRAPRALGIDPDEQPLLLAVPSPHHEISSTHVEIRPGAGADHGAAVAVDLGSTNGTVVTVPGLPPEALRPGIPVQLLPGAVVDIGDGLTIEVIHP